MRKSTLKLGAPLAALLFVAAACGDDDGESTATTAPTAAAAATTAAPATTAAAATTAAPATTAAAATTAAPATTAAAETTAAPETTAAVSETALADAGCPNPLVIQTDWFPEADHGWTYQFVGTGGEIDATKGEYSGDVGGVKVVVRAGGPYVAYSSPSNQMYQAPDVFMAYADTGDAIRTSKTLPVTAVFASYDIGPQIIYWDPAKYPDVKTLEDVGATAGDGKIFYFESAAYMDYLIGKGIIKQSQVDPSYGGSPDLFIANGDLFQQGFLTNEVYSYENLIEGWKKPLAWALVHDAGFEIYQSSLSVKPASVTEYADCLTAIVPMFQQALVDYMTDPTTTNHQITEIVDAMHEAGQFWQVNDELNNDATQRMIDNKLVSDAGNGYVGDMDCTRVQALIDEFVPILQAANKADGLKDGLTCADIVDNQFIDQTISLGF